MQNAPESKNSLPGITTICCWLTSCPYLRFLVADKPKLLDWGRTKPTGQLVRTINTSQWISESHYLSELRGVTLFSCLMTHIHVTTKFSEVLQSGFKAVNVTGDVEIPLYKRWTVRTPASSKRLDRRRFSLKTIELKQLWVTRSHGDLSWTGSLHPNRDVGVTCREHLLRRSMSSSLSLSAEVICVNVKMKMSLLYFSLSVLQLLCHFFIIYCHFCIF